MSVAAGRGRKRKELTEMNWVQCEACNDWVIFENSRITGKFEEVKDKSFKCRFCSTEEKLVLANKEISDLKKKIEELEKGKDTIGGLVQSEVSKSWSEIAQEVKGDLKATEEKASRELDSAKEEIKVLIGSKASASNSDEMNMSDIVDQLLTDKMREEDDKKRRSNKLVVFGIAEAEGSSKEREDHDINKMKDILQTLKINEEVVAVNRLGKKNGNIKRPLLVTVHEEKKKWHIISKSKDLRGSATWEGVFISPDLTVAERKAETELRKSLKEKRDQSSKNGDGREWMIRKGKLIERDAAQN
jgi:hypothetical protein